jgi:hypothetical protein
MTEQMKKALRIKKIYEQIWLELENVSAVGTGTTENGRTCLVISLVSDDPVTKDIFPREIEDIPIHFKVSGEMDAL